MKENLLEMRDVETVIEKDTEPTAEIIGTMDTIMKGKWRGVEQIFHF